MKHRISSILHHAESTLRHSRLAGYLPFLRERFPRLHRILLSARDFLVPYSSIPGVTRYQHRAIQRYNSIIRQQDLSGWVLELGSDSTGLVLKELSTSLNIIAVGINPIVDRAGDETSMISRKDPIRLAKSDARCLPFEQGTFSSVFSVATLEHINNLDLALQESFRVLKSGGVFYADFGPIWSCSVGHHVYAEVDGEEARHWKPGKNPVPNYAHLLYTPQEMREILKKRVSPRLLEAIVEWIYSKEDINRLFYEDYIRTFEESPFTLVSLKPVMEQIDGRVHDALQRKYPDKREFRCRMMEVVLKKS